MRRWRAREKLYGGEVEEIRASSRLCFQARWWPLNISQSMDDRIVDVVRMAWEMLLPGGYRRRRRLRVSPVNTSVWRSITSLGSAEPMSESMPSSSSHAAPSRHI